VSENKVPWNGAPQRVRAPYVFGSTFPIGIRITESGNLRVLPKVGGKFLLTLNTGLRPIAKK